MTNSKKESSKIRVGQEAFRWVITLLEETAVVFSTFSFGI